LPSNLNYSQATADDADGPEVRADAERDPRSRRRRRRVASRKNGALQTGQAQSLLLRTGTIP